MQIIRITTQAQFDELVDFAQLAVYQFGPLVDLPVDADDETAVDAFVAVAVEGDEVVAYISADMHGVWCVETREGYTGRGYAKALVAASGARHFCEVCGDGGLLLAEACGCTFDVAEDANLSAELAARYL